MKALKIIYAVTLVLIISAGIWKQTTLNKAVTGEVDRPIYLVPTSENRVALTFDISWGEESPGPILKILRDEGVKATFFLSGPWVKRHPDLANQIKADGHEIASHGYRHINYSPLSKSEIIQEVLKAQEVIKAVTGVETKYIRTPNGDYDAEAIQAIREANHTAIHWSIDSKDWLNPGVQGIVDQVLGKASRGAIILMHASDSCKQTAAALPRIIQGLREKGLEINTVGQLLEGYLNRKPPLAR